MPTLSLPSLFGQTPRWTTLVCGFLGQQRAASLRAQKKKTTDSHHAWVTADTNGLRDLFVLLSLTEQYTMPILILTLNTCQVERTNGSTDIAFLRAPGQLLAKANWVNDHFEVG